MFDLTNQPDLEAYYLAPGGEGEHAETWKDKPHRLVYDLVKLASEARSEVETARRAGYLCGLATAKDIVCKELSHVGMSLTLINIVNAGIQQEIDQS